MGSGAGVRKRNDVCLEAKREHAVDTCEETRGKCKSREREKVSRRNRKKSMRDLKKKTRKKQRYENSSMRKFGLLGFRNMAQRKESIRILVRVCGIRKKIKEKSTHRLGKRKKKFF